MKFCCSAFQELFTSSDEKGFSVEGKVFEGDRYFVLIFRPFTKTDNDLIDRNEFGYMLIDPKFRDRLTLCTKGEIPIHFCPICGKELSRLILGSEHQFDEIVKMEQT